MLAVWAAARMWHRRDIVGGKILDVTKMHFFGNSCVAVAYLLWPVLVVQALRITDCSVQIAGEFFVASDITVKCYTGAHVKLRAMALFELCTVVPALPVFLWFRLRYRALGPGTFNRSHLYFLYAGFRKGYEYWEAVVLARKFLVLVMTVFLASNTYGLQVAAAMGSRQPRQCYNLCTSFTTTTQSSC